MTPGPVEVRRDVQGQMRDGTVLRADLYVPPGPGPFPILLRRTPYSKDTWARLGTALARNGYLVVVQDIRGRHASDGEWVWAFATEAQRIEATDGYDSVEWAASLPDSTGEVGVWGHSYDAWAAWRLAGERPPSLRGVLAAGISVNLLDVTRGILDLGRRLEWCYLEAADARRRAGRSDGPGDADQAGVTWASMERGKWLWFHPLAEIPEQVFASITPMLEAYYGQIDYELWSLGEIHPQVEVPTCVVTGWWDRFARGVDHFTSMRDRGPAELRDSHRLVVGPWSHDPDGFESAFDVLGDVHLGRRSFVDIVTGFFDPLLKDEPAGSAGPPVEVFTLGLNRWQSLSSWPPPDATTTRLYLHSSGHANTPDGDGWLDGTAPLDEVPDRYVFDPRDPVMSLMSDDAQLTPRDQRWNDHRRDKLVYQTAPLEEPVELCGLVQLELWAGSDAPDTDWVARLIRVDTDGVPVNIAEGIQRARYRGGYELPQLLPGGQPHRYLVDLSPVSIVFRRGERIRLDITSSDFPNFDRNHNTGRAFATDPELRSANQAVYHRAGTASCLRIRTRPVTQR